MHQTAHLLRGCQLGGEFAVNRTYRQQIQWVSPGHRKKPRHRTLISLMDRLRNVMGSCSEQTHIWAINTLTNIPCTHSHLVTHAQAYMHSMHRYAHKFTTKKTKQRWHQKTIAINSYVSAGSLSYLSVWNPFIEECINQKGLIWTHGNICLGKRSSCDGRKTSPFPTFSSSRLALGKNSAVVSISSEACKPSK